MEKNKVKLTKVNVAAFVIAAGIGFGGGVVLPYKLVPKNSDLFLITERIYTFSIPRTTLPTGEVSCDYVITGDNVDSKISADQLNKIKVSFYHDYKKVKGIDLFEEKVTTYTLREIVPLNIFNTDKAMQQLEKYTECVELINNYKQNPKNVTQEQILELNSILNDLFTSKTVKQKVRIPNITNVDELNNHTRVDICDPYNNIEVKYIQTSYKTLAHNTIEELWFLLGAFGALLTSTLTGSVLRKIRKK